MNKIVFAFALLIFLSCSQKKAAPATDTEVATAFIRDLLDNNMTDARTFLLDDEKNKQTFDLVEQKMKTLPKAEQENYKKADIIINEISNVSDSITIVNYSNSYKKEAKNKIKLVRSNGKWLVDFQYTFSGNM